MDQLTTGVPDLAARIRLAASEAGVVPRDPLAPLVEALADIPADVERRIAPVLLQMAATRQHPVVDEGVLRQQLAQAFRTQLGVVTRAVQWRTAVIAAGLLVAALLVGAGGGYWYAVTSRGGPVAIKCDPHPAGVPFSCTMQLRGD